MKRTFLASAGLAIVVAACGGGSMSETEYVENLNALVVNAAARFEAAGAAFGQIADPTMEEYVAFVEQQLAIEYDVRDTFDTLDPPDSIDDVNQVMVDTLGQIVAVAEGLVDASDTVNSLAELESTPEFVEYQTVNADADSMCFDVQAKINDLSTTEVIDNPWIADLRMTVQAFLDCEEA